MKQSLTVEDLNQLTDEQRQRLNEWWMPELFQRAVAYICRNAEEDGYEAYEFVIGGVSVGQNSVGLTDIKAVIQHGGQDASREQTEDGFVSQAVESYFSNDDDEDGVDEERAVPDELLNMTFDFFAKEDCLPLFTVGQLIDILQKLNYGDGTFFMGVDKTDEDGWVDRQLPAVFGDIEYREAELCDALWAAVLETL